MLVGWFVRPNQLTNYPTNQLIYLVSLVTIGVIVRSSLLSEDIALTGMNNLILKHEDISKGIKEKNLDLITLDLPEPWQVTKHAEKSLKEGGYLVVYLPNLLQMQRFVLSLKGTSFKLLETVELLERKWFINEQIMRPEFQMLGHTGFMCFCRKM